MTGLLDIPADAYHRDDLGNEQPSLSSSIAHTLITQSPAHAKAAHPKLNPNYQREEKEVYDIGTAAHRLLLEGVAGCQVIEADDWRTKAAKEERDAARESGKLPLLAKHWDAVCAMVDATRAQLDRVECDPPLFVDGKPEQTLVWEEDGVTCRARLDWLHDSGYCIDDFKTTSKSANPEAWSRTLFNNGCDIQCAFYLRGLQQATGKHAQFRFVVQETFPPYALSVVSLAPDALELARSKVKYAIDLWRTCLERDEWPAYTPRIAYAEAPAWDLAKWEAVAA